ncbi:MAG: hypothetical protein ACK5X6_09190 [Chryseotalea sp.]
MLAASAKIDQMIKYLFLWVLVFSIIMICCNPKTNEENLSNDINTFKSNYDTLKTFKLPLILNWKIWNKLSEEHYNDNRIIGGNDLLKMPFGKLVDSELFKGVIFIYNDPILITIDKNQNPIDTLFLLGDNFSNDPSITTIEQAKITADLKIQLIDSVFTYDTDENENRIESTMKLSISVKEYKIENNGIIKNIKE